MLRAEGTTSRRKPLCRQTSALRACPQGWPWAALWDPALRNPPGNCARPGRFLRNPCLPSAGVGLGYVPAEGAHVTKATKPRAASPRGFAGRTTRAAVFSWLYVSPGGGTGPREACTGTPPTPPVPLPLTASSLSQSTEREPFAASTATGQVP